MKKNVYYGLIVLLMGFSLLGLDYGHVSAYPNKQGRSSSSLAGNPQAAPTLIPTVEPVTLSGPTPEARVLPPVGSNAGLVIGASVLVLIIIGGVLSSRLRAKH